MELKRNWDKKGSLFQYRSDLDYDQLIVALSNGLVHSLVVGWTLA